MQHSTTQYKNTHKLVGRLVVSPTTTPDYIERVRSRSMPLLYTVLPLSVRPYPPTYHFHTSTLYDKVYKVSVCYYTIL